MIGGRPGVRCPNCYHLGHALNASKMCPIEVLNRAVMCAFNRTRPQWARIKFEAEDSFVRMKNILFQLGDDHPGPVKDKMWELCDGYLKLCPETGKPLGMGKSYNPHLQHS